MKTVHHISAQGAEKLKDERRSLADEHSSIISAMRDSKEQESGDESENSEYMRLQAELARVQKAVSKIDDFFQNCQIVDFSGKAGQPSEKVLFGCLVQLENVDTGKLSEYRVLGVMESDPKNGVISYLSPLGKELVGKRIGDEVCIETPSDEDVVYEVLSIKF